MKKLNLLMAALMLLASAGTAAFLIGCTKAASNEQGGSQVHHYTCKMHPEVVQDKPGNCPKCGMALVQKDYYGHGDPACQHKARLRFRRARLLHEGFSLL